jgi:hypothetical protein
MCGACGRGGKKKGKEFEKQKGKKNLPGFLFT